MVFALKGFRSLWGAPSAARLGLTSSTDKAAYADKLLARISAQGFDGIEASLGDLAQLGDARVVNELLVKHELQLIVGVYSGWVDYEDGNLGQQFEGVRSHLDRYKQQLTQVCEAFPARTWINAHTGSDHWGKLDQIEFIAHAMEIENSLDVANVSYETHRGRIFYSPWPTLELLEAFPSLKLTLDLSHWCVVTERLLDSEHDHRRLWQRVLPHVYHVHARIGTAQGSQVAQLPGNAAVADEVLRFETLWERVWQQQHARFQSAELMKDMDANVSRPFTTLTPEYGPAPYAPRDAKTHELDGYDVDALCESQMDRQRLRFEAFLVEKTLEQAAKDYA